MGEQIGSHAPAFLQRTGATGTWVAPAARITNLPGSSRPAMLGVWSGEGGTAKQRSGRVSPLCRLALAEAELFTEMGCQVRREARARDQGSQLPSRPASVNTARGQRPSRRISSKPRPRRLCTAAGSLICPLLGPVRQVRRKIPSSRLGKLPKCMPNSWRISSRSAAVKEQGEGDVLMRALPHGPARFRHRGRPLLPNIDVHRAAPQRGRPRAAVAARSQWGREQAARPICSEGGNLGWRTTPPPGCPSGRADSANDAKKAMVRAT